MDALQNTGLIFDVGAHRGEDSDFYLKLGYRVVAVEANPELAAELGARFRDSVDRSDYVVVDKAIGETDGTTTFFVNRAASVWGTADPKWARRNEEAGTVSEEISVQCVRFADLITRYGCPHYLKIDIEGADMMCINGLESVPCRPKFISLESTKTSWSSLMAEFDALEALGYTSFKVCRQGRHGDGRFTNLNGTTVDYSFEKEASGPFGEDLPGPWVSRRTATLQYVPIFLLYKTIGGGTLISRLFSHVPRGPSVLMRAVAWYDTHAMRP